MKKALLAIPVLCMGLLVLTRAQTSDQVSRVKAHLSGFQQNNPISTTGSGDFTAQISADNSMITYTLTYSNIAGGSVLASHIHFGQWWASAGVIAFLCGGGGKPSCPTPSGTVTGTIVAADIIGPTEQGIAAGALADGLRAIRSGVTYVNIHSETYPGGEIRGQIRPKLGLLLGRF